MLLKALREGLGRAIVFVDFITRPKPIQRSPAEQRAAEQAASALSLYQFHACPFCIRTRRAIHRLNLPIEYRDAQHDAAHRAELEQAGGKVQVPCLRIDAGGETTWLYETDAVIEYLNRRFDPGQSDAAPAAKQPS